MPSSVDMISSETALVVIDLQWAMFAGIGFGPLHDADGLLKRVAEMIDRARKANVAVTVTHEGGPMRTLHLVPLLIALSTLAAATAVVAASATASPEPPPGSVLAELPFEEPS